MERNIVLADDYDARGQSMSATPQGHQWGELADFVICAPEVIGEHGHGKIDISMSWTIYHSLSNDLCAARPQRLRAFTNHVGDI